MCKSFIATVSVLMAATAFTSTAGAGGGVRLNFGLPLGHFTATPARGGGTVRSSAYERRAQVRKAAIARAEAEKKIEQKKAARLDKPNLSKVKVSAPAKSVTTGETSTRASSATGSIALIETRAGASGASQAASAAEGEPVISEARAQVGETETETETATARETAPAAPKTEAVEQKSAAGEGVNCRKFIPAVGITVSVSCSD